MKKKRINLWLLSALVCGLSLGTGSCKDSEEELTGEQKEQREMEQQEQQNELFNVLSQLADVSAADSNFLSKTYEPAIGQADEGSSTTRIVNTNTMEAAAERFANLADISIDENTATYTWRDDNLGTMTYTRTNDGTSWATVDVNIKQVPHLQRIVYRAPEQASDNGKFAGRAYYRFGDVVSREMKNKDGSTYTEYWICVRPAFGPEGKEDSHWACLNVLPEENIYEKTKDDQVFRLPTKLGTNKEHMQNTAELLYAILHPEEWEKNATSGTKGLKIFYDFKAANLKYHNQYFWKNVCKGWDEKNIWQLALNIDKKSLMEWEHDGYSFLYKGYSWMMGWNCTLYIANYRNGSGKELNMHKATYADTKNDFSYLGGIDLSKCIGYESEKYRPSIDGDDKSSIDLWYSWPIRVLKGQKLSSDGRYDKFTAIYGTKDVYRYYRDILPITDQLADPEETEKPITYPPLNVPKVGCLIGKDGEFYLNTESAKLYGTEPVAIVCALNGKKRVEKGAAWNGLAMALSPTEERTWIYSSEYQVGHPCTAETVSSIAEMSGPLNGIAATKQMYNGCNGVANQNHHHHAADDCSSGYDRIYKRELSDEAKATGNFSDWFMPSSGQWVLAYKGLGYNWTGQGYDMTADAANMRSIFAWAGVDPETEYVDGTWRYPVYWATTQNVNGDALLFGFGNCFWSGFEGPLHAKPTEWFKALPFLAFKYDGGATED